MEELLMNAHLEFTISYSDLHPYHGGAAYQLMSDGQLRYYHGQTEADHKDYFIDQSAVDSIKALVIKYRLWEQQLMVEKLDVGQSRAQASIKVGEEEVIVWEWFNDLEKNDRLIHLLNGFKHIISAI